MPRLYSVVINATRAAKATKIRPLEIVDDDVKSAHSEKDLPPCPID
jgi:hypothetical protein